MVTTKSMRKIQLKRKMIVERMITDTTPFTKTITTCSDNSTLRTEIIFDKLMNNKQSLKLSVITAFRMAR
jgi:hypothetical protein